MRILVLHFQTLDLKSKNQVNFDGFWHSWEREYFLPTLNIIGT